MAINKKGKRRITVNDIPYLWWVFNEWNQATFDGKQIRIVAESQVGFIEYGLEQQEDKRFAVVALRNYEMAVHLRCPKFEDENKIIKPAGIAQLINWCLTDPQVAERILTHGVANGNRNRLVEEPDYPKLLTSIIAKFQNTPISNL